MSDYVSAEVIDRDTVRIPSCPNCHAPVRRDRDDGGGSHCTICPWRGDGYVTMWDGYPDTVKMAPASINGPVVLTGGRVEHRIFRSADDGQQNG